MGDRAIEGGPRSRAQLVADEIEDELLGQRLPVGTHLGRRVEFMDRFHISPPIMSETMRILRSRGLIDVRRGAGGGLFVASQPPQIRLGAMDLWLYDDPVSPLELFEARVHLESALTAAAFERATPADHAAMERTVRQLGEVSGAADYLSAVMGLHRAIADASQIEVLTRLHASLVVSIQTRLSRAEFVDGYEGMLRHSVEVHQGLVDAIVTGNRAAFAKVTSLHDGDLVRADDPRRSPHLSR